MNFLAMSGNFFLAHPIFKYLVTFLVELSVGLVTIRVLCMCRMTQKGLHKPDPRPKFLVSLLVSLVAYIKPLNLFIFTSLWFSTRLQCSTCSRKTFRNIQD